MFFSLPFSNSENPVFRYFQHGGAVEARTCPVFATFYSASFWALTFIRITTADTACENCDSSTPATQRYSEEALPYIVETGYCSSCLAASETDGLWKSSGFLAICRKLTPGGDVHGRSRSKLQRTSFEGWERNRTSGRDERNDPA